MVAKNWKGRTGEVDLIAYDGPWLVLVKVKTRRLRARLPLRSTLTSGRKGSWNDWPTNSRIAMSSQGSRFDVIGVETRDQLHYCLRHYTP